MGVSGILFLVVALVLIGVGLAIGLVACAVAAALLGIGAITSSVLVGVLSRRPATGVRALLLQCGVLSGVPAGAICALLVSTLLAGHSDHVPALIAGACGGAFAGIVIALMLDVTWRRSADWLMERLPAAQIRRNPGAAPVPSARDSDRARL